MRRIIRYVLTAAIVALVIIMILMKYWDYATNPWTRNGQVRAQIIQITPRVSGPVVKLPIIDNQFVKAGELLFTIDPSTFEANLEQVQAQLDATVDNYNAMLQRVEAAKATVSVSRASISQSKSAIKEMEATIEKNEAEYIRQKGLLPRKATSQKAVEWAKANHRISIEQHKTAVAALEKSKASLLESEANLAEAKAKLGALEDENASIRSARAAVRQAELDLEFTRLRAPVDGYVTNLNLTLGSQAVANQPVLALVDINSFWIYGFFKETSIGKISQNNLAVVTLMSYPDRPLEGYVDSLGWGIAQQDGSTGFELLPNVSPTFDWIRLAQRVPVRIHLTDVPEEIKLRVGTTCSVLVMTESTGKGKEKLPPPVPSALQ